jgi:hypothetical protein
MIEKGKASRILLDRLSRDRLCGDRPEDVRSLRARTNLEL